MASERISITGNPNESLSSRYFPGDSESPTIGQLHALVKVANGFAIPDDIKQATLEAASRYKHLLEGTIDSWNRLVRDTAEVDVSFRVLGFRGMCDIMSLSYGSDFVNSEIRRALILRAVDSAEKSLNISRN